MQLSFLGYSVKKIMELDLDVKDVAILRFFDDFRKSGKMNYEIIDGVKYYWISYQSIENELPFLGLGKRSIMMRMLKLRDLGVLSHYTKKNETLLKAKKWIYLGENIFNISEAKTITFIGSFTNKGAIAKIINRVYKNHSAPITPVSG